MYHPILFLALFIVVFSSSIKFVCGALRAFKELENRTCSMTYVRTIVVRAFYALAVLCLISLQLVASVYSDGSGLRLLYYSIRAAIFG